MKKITLLLIIWFISIFLSGCFKKPTEENKVTDEKKEFLIETIKVSELDMWKNIKKTGKIVWAENFLVKTQVNWKVSKINFKEWDNIKKWEIIIELEDNIWSYWLSLQRAQNNLNKAKLAYDEIKINLDKQINENKIWLEKEKSNYVNLERQIRENEKQFEIKLDNSNLSNENSTSKLELENLENNYKKAELDYNNLILSDEEQIINYKKLLKSQHNSLKSLNKNISLELDKLFGVSKINEDYNKYFDQYLWAKNLILKNKMSNSIKELFEREKKLDDLTLDDLDEEKIIEIINIFEKDYYDLEKILKDSKIVIRDSVTSSTFTQNDIDWYISLMNWLQTTLQNQNANFINYSNSVRNFFNTYIEKQNSSKKSLELLQKQIDLTKKSLELASTNDKIDYTKLVSNNKNQLNIAKLNIENLENNYNKLLKSKNITLKQYQNNITEAEISYNEIKNTYNKMTIKAPISWTISSIKIDLWEEVSVWIPLFEIVNNNSQEIEVSFTEDELKYLKGNDLVNFTYENKIITWNIYSISTVSDKNFNYKANISFTNNIDLLWNFVEVRIPISTSKTLIPLSIVKITAKNNWYIYIYNEEEIEIEKKYVKLWKIWWENIEVTTELNLNDLIILSNVDNYDKNLFKIVIK